MTAPSSGASSNRAVPNDLRLYPVSGQLRLFLAKRHFADNSDGFRRDISAHVIFPSNSGHICPNKAYVHIDTAIPLCYCDRGAGVPPGLPKMPNRLSISLLSAHGERPIVTDSQVPPRLLTARVASPVHGSRHVSDPRSLNGQPSDPGNPLQ